ncbi:MAG: serine/threonine-protein kinase [Myxococcota bacterium]
MSREHHDGGAELDDGDAVGDFRVLRRLDRSATGVVYEALALTLPRVVALKVLAPELTRDVAGRARFVRAAHAAAAIDHPAVPTVYQFGFDGARVFIAMEIVRGQSLRERLANGCLPLAEALRIAGVVAGALGAAHAVGVVHRELRPECIVLSDGLVKVLDCGFAALDPATPTSPPSDDAPSVVTAEGHVVAALGYRAPEQAGDGPVDARADVFALGAVLYEMLTGLPPDAAAGRAPRAPGLSGAPPLHGVRSDVPPALAAIIDRRVAADLSERFADGRELAAALAALTLTSRRASR